MSTQTPLISALSGAIGCSLRSLQSQLLFVEYAGKLSQLDLLPGASIVSQGSTVLKGTFAFDLENGAQGGVGPNFDIWWEQMTTVARQMVPQNGASLINLGVTNFAAVTPAGLQSLNYSSTPIPGSNDASNKLVVGDVFAVHTNAGNFAKVQINVYGYDLKINWVTYKINPAYKVLGSGYNQPEDVKVSTDNVHAYVTERPGTLLRVTLASANRAAATVVASGMAAPQQMFLDEAHGRAYVVEYANPGNLWRVDLATGSKTAIVSSLEYAVGLVLSADLQFAYVSEQSAGPDKGRISRVQISNGASTKLATGLVSPFHLSWSDSAQSALLVAERDPANRITSVPVNGSASSLVVGGVPVRPSSVAVLSAGRLLVCSDQVIERVDYTLFQPAGPLLMGIGFIPFDKVGASGLASTDPGYFYQVTNVPFGGTLPLMLNFQRAANDGAAYYRVRIDGVLRNDAWSDYKWNGLQYVLQNIGPVNVGGQPDFYPVHPIADLFLWMNPTLGMLASSTNLSNGMHQIVVDFCNAVGAVIESSAPLNIMVNNQSCVAALAAPTISGVGADTVCGLLHYGVASNPNPVTMALTATHPANYANWSFSLIKGVNQVMSASGAVPGPVAPITATVAVLLDKCVVAGFAEYLYVAATINNGWSRQSQYDASAAFAFVLAA